MNTRDQIIKNAKKIFAKESLDGLSMRRLAAQSDIALSVIYHYFSGKDDLLKELYRETVVGLNEKSRTVLTAKSAKAKLRQYFEFCFDNAHDIVFCHKYYLSYRSTFRKNASGYLPVVILEVIQEIIREGVRAKELKSKDELFDSKYIYNAILSLIVEYYPQKLTQINQDNLIQKAVFRLENALFA
jgi:AcrR family transcriptional regulator